MPTSLRLAPLATLAVVLTLVILWLHCRMDEGSAMAVPLSGTATFQVPAEPLLNAAGSQLQISRLNPLQLTPGAVRLVILSDTHTHHSELSVPDGDILIHAGDYALARTSNGRLREKQAFDEWLGQLPHKHKIFVQGNHDEGAPGSASAALQHAISLVDELMSISIHGRTVRIYGSPWQPQFKGWPTWLPASECKKKWKQIPNGIDVLVTHTPMLKYGDGDKGYDAGDAGLLDAVKKTRPRLAVFGHIHDGWPRAGFVPETSSAAGFEGTTFLNVAVTDNRAKLANAPVVFDI